MPTPLPKAELHVHIEGTLEPELAFALAERNGTTLPHPTIDDLHAAYSFTDLQSFLDLYYSLTDVLRTQQDFTDLAEAYLTRAAAQASATPRSSSTPQAHTTRGIALDTVINGLTAALDTSLQRHGISTALIMCFLRDRPATEALDTLQQARPHLHHITAVGLDSAEVGHPPEKFTHIFDAARDLGLRCVAHAGEEGPASYIWQALNLLKAERIDHGIRCLDDPDLVAHLAATQTPLTVCPFSNVRLRAVDTLADHPLPALMDAGLLVTVNSDDPAYFGATSTTTSRAYASTSASPRDNCANSPATPSPPPSCPPNGATPSSPNSTPTPPPDTRGPRTRHGAHHRPRLLHPTHRLAVLPRVGHHPPVQRQREPRRRPGPRPIPVREHPPPLVRHPVPPATRAPPPRHPSRLSHAPCARTSSACQPRPRRRLLRPAPPRRSPNVLSTNPHHTSPTSHNPPPRPRTRTPRQNSHPPTAIPRTRRP
ncbi:adenosine deaminase, partial [Nocardiopsis sp. CNR-923]|uniref:adenosine deaminase n=1 Tax=Nocardiopsis sp. CNR-923 TaxID=1904965 RepID=UPI0013013D0E